MIPSYDIVCLPQNPSTPTGDGNIPGWSFLLSVGTRIALRSLESIHEGWRDTLVGVLETLVPRYVLHTKSRNYLITDRITPHAYIWYEV